VRVVPQPLLAAARAEELGAEIPKDRRPSPRRARREELWPPEPDGHVVPASRPGEADAAGR
jgi:hypothetical protein